MWLRSSKTRSHGTSAHRPTPQRPRLVRPELELLEGRDLPSTYVVADLTDSGGVVGSGLTGDLRYCIGQVNAGPGNDTIQFSIGAVGSVQIINLTGGTLTVNRAVLLDGLSQGGAGYAGAPLIELQGSAGVGLDLTSGAANSTIRGLSFDNMGVNGIQLDQ